MIAHHAVPTRFAACLAALALAACGGSDSTGPVLHQLAGTWKLTEHVAGTGNSVVCDDTASVTVAQQGSHLTVSGGGNLHCRWSSGDSLDTWADYSATAVLDGHTVTLTDADCPYVGTVNGSDDAVTGTVDCAGATLGVSGRITGPWSLVRTDAVLPAVSATALPAAPTHGDTLTITVTATDNGVLTRVGVRAEMQGLSPSDGTCPDPGVTLGDSVAGAGDSLQHVFTVVVPGCTGGVALTAFAVDTAGNRGVFLGTTQVRLPVSTLVATLSDSIYTLGDSAYVTVSANNADGLAWLGVRWTHVSFLGQDSVAPASHTTGSHTFAVRIPPGDQPFQLLARVFARHTLGFMTGEDLPYARTTDATIVPVRALQIGGVPTDWVWSPKHGRVFLAARNVASVLRLDPSSFTSASSYPLFAGTYGTSLDLTGNEDSIVVGRADMLAVTVIPVGGGQITTIPVTPPDAINIYDVRRVRIVAGDRVLIGVGSGSGGSIQELLLGTGAQRTRIPWYGYGTFERGGRARLLVVDATSPVGSRLYLAATDTFLPSQSGVLHATSPVADTAGTYWQVGSELWDADLGFVRGMGGGAEPVYAACALAPDASRAYCPKNDGYTEYDAATGLRVRAVHLPVMPVRLLPLGAGRVMAWRDSTLYLVTVP